MCVCVCVLVGLRILHSYLIESTCTQYEKIDKLKCKLQASSVFQISGLVQTHLPFWEFSTLKDYYLQWALHTA